MRRRLTPIAVAIVVLVVVGAITAARIAKQDDDPTADAISLLRSQRRFDSSREAVESFAGVYSHLVDATKMFPKGCEVSAGRGRCLALNEAASWSVNFATAAGGCTQPAIQEGRLAILAFVERASALGDDETHPPPLPAIPGC